MASGRVEVDGPATGVHRIRIVHPEHRGALSDEVLDGRLRALAETPSAARCLLLASCGDAFSAGYDIRALGEPIDVERAARTIAPDRVELFDALAAQAAELASGSARAHLRALRALRGGGERMRDDARIELRRARQDGLASPDFAEGIAAFREHRPPRFPGI